MKAGIFRLTMQAAVLALLIPAAAHARDTQEKIEYCKNCHGSHGQGFQAFYTAPRLAGQTVPYMENQFKALLSHRRDNPAAKQFMVHALDGTDASMRASIAEYFSRQSTGPAGGGPRHLISTGRKIYEEGVPDSNVPSCSACHGPKAQGDQANPRLAGQLYSYTVAQLKGWRNGYRRSDPASPGETNVMQAIAKGLTNEQISAVAAYLSHQR